MVQRHKVLGLWFTASEGFRNCFGPLKQSMWAAWGRVRADYGRLRCSESAWLELQLFMACVPPAGLYGAEVWGGLQLRGEARLGRLQLEAAHLRMLKMLLGLRRSTQTEVVYQESGQGPLSHTWLLRSARFWNGVARRQPSDLYHAVLQDCCRDAVVGDVHNWARGMWRALAAVGYSLQLSVVEVPVIDLACLHVKLAEAQAAKWSGLQRCPRTCASLGVMLVTYRAWFQRPQRCSADLLSLRVSPRRLRLLLRFRTGCHDLPVNVLRRGRVGWSGSCVSARSVGLVRCVMSTISSLSALPCRPCAGGGHTCLRGAPQCSSLCGRPILLALLSSFLRVWRCCSVSELSVSGKALVGV